jgi:hypothetical protein
LDLLGFLGAKKWGVVDVFALVVADLQDQLFAFGV